MQLGGVDADAVVHIRRGEHLLASPTQNVYTTYSSYKQIIVLYALTLAALDNVRKDRIRLFIALLTCTQLDYVHDLAEEAVVYFVAAKTVVPMVIVFSFDLIEESVTPWLNAYAKYFIRNIQDASGVDTNNILDEMHASMDIGSRMRGAHI